MTSQIPMLDGDASPPADAVLQRLALEVVDRLGDVGEVLAAKVHRCLSCGRDIVPGETHLVAEVTYAKGSAHWRRRLCGDCYDPSDLDASVRRVDLFRVLDWNSRRERVTRTGRAGRPSLHFARAEVELVRRLRGEGAGEGRLAELFAESTGRRVGARTLSKIGR